jgi:cysteine synthase A
MKAYGAEVVLSPAEKGMAGAIATAEELAKQHPGSFIPGQFVNPANPAAHEATTGPEIWADTDGSIDIFVAGAGTGGTVTGCGRFLKQQNPDIQIIATEPADSPVLSGGKAGKHGIQGIGAGFVPEILDMSVIDEVVTVKDADAFAAARMIARTEAILTGISSGAALHGAMELAKLPEHAGKTIVVLLPDTGMRYLSTDLFV